MDSSLFGVGQSSKIKKKQIKKNKIKGLPFPDIQAVLQSLETNMQFLCWIPQILGLFQPHLTKRGKMLFLDTIL